MEEDTDSTASPTPATSEPSFIDEHIEGLVDEDHLQQIARFTELGIDACVTPPQLVAIGGQATGKSSVLELLTGLKFAHGFYEGCGLVTKVSYRRHQEQRVQVTITPKDEERMPLARLSSFRRQFKKIEDVDFDQLFNDVMDAINAATTPALSDQDTLPDWHINVLEITISGPTVPHLTIIDTPGLRHPDYRPSTPIVNTLEDLAMSYLKDSRTIILAVRAARGYAAYDDVFALAEHSDKRTKGRIIGVLTDPHLVTDISLIRRGCYDNDVDHYIVNSPWAYSVAVDPLPSEALEYIQSPTPSTRRSRRLPIKRVGAAALRSRLRKDLTEMSKANFLRLESDLLSTLKAKEQRLTLSSHCPTSDSQRLYLIRASIEFKEIVNDALAGNYHKSAFFTGPDQLRLATQMSNLKLSFARQFEVKGHQSLFPGSTYDRRRAELDHGVEGYHFLCTELHGIVMDGDYSCPKPKPALHLGDMKRIYEQSHSSGMNIDRDKVLRLAFKDQTSKWEMMITAYVSFASSAVQSFIRALLKYISPTPGFDRKLLEHALLKKLRATYQRAMNHARFLVHVEREGTLSTSRDDFPARLENARLRHTREATLEQYYRVARHRLTDNIWIQVIDSMLMGDKGPLRVFSVDMVAALTEEELELIVGDDEETAQERDKLERDIEGLKKGIELLEA